MNSGSDPQAKLRRWRLNVAAVAGMPAVLLALIVGGCTDKKPENSQPSNNPIVPAAENNPDVEADTGVATDQSAGDNGERSEFRARALALSDAGLQEIRRLADAGDVVAMVLLARRYEIGQGVGIDYFEADVWYTKAARLGNSEAARCLDRMNSQVPALSSHDDDQNDYVVRAGPWQTFSPRELAGHFRQAAERGEPAAMVKLADALTTGNGVDQDVAQAEEWLEKAVAAYNKLAAKGDPAAMLGLAEIFLARSPSDDAETEHEWAEGIKWCQRAVEAENSEAMLLLAELHVHGRGVEQNEQTTFKLRHQAAESGNVRAMGLVAEMFESGQGTARDQIAANQWYRRAAQVGDVTALIRLGQRLAKDEGGAEDDGTAIDFFLRAIRLGDDSGEAACQVGLACASGNGVERNDDRAIEYLRCAAQRNHAEALFQLGQMFHQGRSVERDPDQATVFFLRAAGLGHQGALQVLAPAREASEGGAQNGHAAPMERNKTPADSALIRAEGVVGPVENGNTVPSWGTLTAVHGDASAAVEGDRLRLTFNRLSPLSSSPIDGELQNSASAGASLYAPRIGQEVTGDFSVAVTFSGPLAWDRPTTVDGVAASPPLGAVSLLIWQDQKNFVRIDRVGALQGDQFQYNCAVLMVKDDLQVFQTSKALESALVRVRLERKGDKIRASLTTNGGQSWVNFRSQNFELPKVVNIGVAAFSDAAGPLIAEFREFEFMPKE